MVQGNGARPALAMTAGLCLVMAVGCGDPPSMEDAMEGDTGGFVRTAAIDRGHLLFARHGCVSCHGVQGHGDGPFGANLHPPPRDFRDASAFHYGTDIESIATTIHDGVVVDGARVMPSFAHLSAADRRSLAVFIRSLAEHGPADLDAAASVAAAVAADSSGASNP